MGLIGKILGFSDAVTAVGATAANVAEVFTPNATRRLELAAQAYQAALAEAAAEFQAAGPGGFDRFVNGLNRMPRPLLALGTLGLFAYAMADPAGFSGRMAGLATVPEPLWWLLGAIVSFYFGAREAHYFRLGKVVPAGPGAGAAAGSDGPAGGGAAADPAAAAVAADNPALRDWDRGRG